MRPPRWRSFADGKNAPTKLSVNFLGLFGPNGPIPLHITEYARERQRHARDHTLVEFLESFQSSYLSLFYRAWAVNQKAADLDRRKTARFPAYIGTLFGIRHRVAAQS